MNHIPLIDGRHHANRMRTYLKDVVAQLHLSSNIKPHLAIIQVGNDAASTVYVQAKVKACEAVDMTSTLYSFPQEATQDTIDAKIVALNSDAMVHGIIVQLPLPAHINAFDITCKIAVHKDVDGLHPFNQGALIAGHVDGLMPCTPLACLDLIYQEMESLVGQNVCIIGCSKLVGLPLGVMLIKQGCTVTFINRSTPNPAHFTQCADILIAAAGSPHLVQADWVKQGAVVIDVGITRIINADGKAVLYGDVDFDAVVSKVHKITPVPGGVGPMTVSYLLTNTVIAAYKSVDKDMPNNPVHQLFEKQLS